MYSDDLCAFCVSERNIMADRRSNKKEKNIKYALDSVVKTEEADTVLITGWVFSINEKNTDITAENAEIISVLKDDRYDVYTHFNKKYEQALLCGFRITLKLSDSKKALLRFSDGRDEERVYIDKKSTEGRMTPLRAIRIILSLMSPMRARKCLSYFKRMGFKRSLGRLIFLLKGGENSLPLDADLRYKKWLSNNEAYNAAKVKKEIDGFKYKPLISVVMPVYNVEEKWLSACIDSITGQFYENWELCIADDCSDDENVRKTLESYKNADSRIKVVYREKNGHISRATNSALGIAQGEYIALADNDDELAPFALYEAVKLINAHPNADLIYSDEDKIDENGNRTEPHFKPDFSPHTLLSSNYISHLGIYRKSIVDDIGGFRTGYEGSQDYDLVLRFCEKTKNIYHIPKVLYHWRILPGSTALSGGEKSYAYVAGKKALKDAVERREYDAEVRYIENIRYYDLALKPRKGDRVSIIIPTKDRADMLEKCLKSIYEKTEGIDFEIIVADNNSSRKETFDLFEKYKAEKDNFKVISLPFPFNFSKINNEAARIAEGNLLLFLNNDTEVINNDWLSRMAGFADLPDAGCVGAKLFYPDDTIQHAGVILGIGGVANHAGLRAYKDDNGYFGRYSVTCNYSAVTAACMMIKKELFFRVGGFEEKLAVAFNDIDLCLRVAELEKYNIFVPHARLYHYESVSRGREDSAEKMERFMQEVDYMKEKWGDRLKNDRFYSRNFSLDSAKKLFCIDILGQRE